jgi:hypothetical protein
MDFGRLDILSKEIDIINAILNGDHSVSFNSLYEKDLEAKEEMKLDKLCEITYKVLNSYGLKDETVLLNMYNEICSNENVGKFCVDFIKININQETQMKSINDRLNELLALDYENIPNFSLKLDYIQTVMVLLLQQSPIDIKTLNKFNDILKAMK